MDKNTVLKIVDSCFHEYASDYRNDAAEKTAFLYDKLSEGKKEETSTESVEVCDKCEKEFKYTGAYRNICHKCEDDFI